MTPLSIFGRSAKSRGRAREDSPTYNNNHAAALLRFVLKLSRSETVEPSQLATTISTLVIEI